ncbi:PRC-barrel domain-containing protein [Actinoplanes hulinensis]|uniref:PRC-barrel domain-containing protein n=1 Tax=Actinoplanes hulinensis TaxID=1144547 RepID=A0ABS7B4K4_9ACTN|nr:PRC-barrel domain-containing protein [Actinoplanes hulinensis]MBW6435959.1 PRC-barrel domain-containing protein [Actinoplanes hulinensis]
MQPTPFTPWTWREPSALGDDPVTVESAEETGRTGVDLVGYRVEATDGHIGSIDKASYDVGDAFLVVDTGPWIFGRKVLLPAGMVQTFDHTERKVYVDRTKEQIKDSPEYDKETFETPEYRRQVGDYYSGSYRDFPY